MIWQTNNFLCKYLPPLQKSRGDFLRAAQYENKLRKARRPVPPQIGTGLPVTFLPQSGEIQCAGHVIKKLPPDLFIIRWQNFFVLQCFPAEALSCENAVLRERCPSGILSCRSAVLRKRIFAETLSCGSRSVHYPAASLSREFHTKYMIIREALPPFRIRPRSFSTLWTWRGRCCG